MHYIKEKLASLDWPGITSEMNTNGFAIIRSIVTEEECEKIVAQYHNQHLYRKTITMERYRFGLGEYKYFNYPLPEIVQTLRKDLYQRLAPIANRWMEMLQIQKGFPGTLQQLKALCDENNQSQPTVLILKYGKGGYNTLHQDLYGEIYFPIQAVLFLNEPLKDYHGGEFVLTQQTPRAQSKAIVLQPAKGDILLFTTNFRPVKGSKGYYRANVKHGVSPLHSGSRHTLGIIFHDALN